MPVSIGTSRASALHGFALALAMLIAGQPALANDTPADRWANRQAEGPYSSPKSSLALEWCIARQLAFPTIIHGEKVTEIDSAWFQQGVQITDSDKERAVTFVANPRMNDRTAAIVKGCI